MAQYTEITSGNPITLSDGTYTFRLDVRSAELFIEQYRTGSWQTIDSFQLPDDPGATFRVGARGGEWRIDQTYDPEIFGFLGAEGLDWDNIDSYTL